MRDNFDLKGYLRHGNKLLNEGIGGYFDLKPLNYLNEDESVQFKEGDIVKIKDGQEYGDDPYMGVGEARFEDLKGQELEVTGTDDNGQTVWINDVDSLPASYLELAEKINELDNEDFFGDDPEEMQMVWMEDVTDKQINDWTCFYQYQVGAIGMESPRFPGIALYASPGFEGADGIVFEAWDEEGNNIDLNPDNPKTNQYVAGKSIYADFESYAEDMEKILPTVESMLKGGGEEEMNEGEPEGDQYDGQYDAHTGPAITSEEEDDDYDPLPWANKGGFDFQDFMDTDLDGSAVERAIDDIIEEFDQIIKANVPKELQYSARIAVKKFWLEKIKNWRS